MILGKQITTPQFPPQYLLLSLLGLNLLLHFETLNTTLYEVLIYIYGMMILCESKQTGYYISLTVPFNIFLLGVDFFQVKLSHRTELTIFIMICVIYRRVISSCLKQLVDSVMLGKDVTFSHVFIGIQFMTVNNFIVYFAGIKRIKHLPIIIRIIQNTKIYSKTSLKALGRFLILILLIELVHLEIVWTIFKCVVTLWFIHVDFTYCFQMKRLLEHGYILYPKWVYYMMFSINCLCRISWLFAPKYAVLIGVIRKIIENYFRLESQSAHLKKNTFMKGVLHYVGIDDIAA